MINLNATLRYLSICTICPSCQTFRMQIIPLGLGCLFRHVEHLFEHVEHLLEHVEHLFKRLYTMSSNFNYFTCLVVCFRWGVLCHHSPHNTFILLYVPPWQKYPFCIQSTCSWYSTGGHYIPKTYP